MTGTVVLILISVLACIALFGVVTRLLEGAPVAWRLLHEAHPAMHPEPGPGAREMRIFVADVHTGGNSGRPKQLLVRYTVDDDCLHAWPVSVRSGASLGVSIPWAAANLTDPIDTQLGPHVRMVVENAMVLVPATAIERELAIRADLRTTTDPMIEEIDP